MMKSLPLLVAALVTTTAPATAQDARPAFAVVASDGAVNDAAVIERILTKGIKPLSVVTVTSLDKALASKADVIVLLSSVELKEGDAATREALRTAKLIGIGSGADLFDQLELEIDNARCAHSAASEILVQKSKLLGDAPRKQSIQLSNESRASDTTLDDYMHIPRKSHLTSVVDVIARVAQDENYGAVVRQGNYVRVGIKLSTDLWTHELKEFVHKIALQLRAQKAEPFTKARWETTKPGTYEFKLARSNDTLELASRSFFFQFAKPTKFSVRVKQKGSENLMLYLHARGGGRQDSERDNDLEFNVEITAADIERRKGGYWELDVANFDPANTAQCILKIEYSQQ